MASPVPEKPLRVLLIDDDQGDYELMAEYLSEPAGHFQLDWASSLRSGRARLATTIPDVVLLDLHLPDSTGLETFFSLEKEAEELPIVIVTGMDDDGSALEAVRRGAQDYLVKNRINSKTLPMSLRYAVERHSSVRQKGRAALTDRVTGLYNRAGFAVFADQHLKGASRDNRAFFVFFAVLHGLGGINEQFGKDEGNQALVTTAAILRETFRTSDVIARMGGDEFAVIATDEKDFSPRVVTQRLKQSQTYHNAQYNRYGLSLSVSAVRYSPADLNAGVLVDKIDAAFRDYKKTAHRVEPPAGPTV